MHNNEAADCEICGFFNVVAQLPDLSAVRRQSLLKGRLKAKREDPTEDPKRSSRVAQSTAQRSARSEDDENLAAEITVCGFVKSIKKQLQG